MAKSPTDETGNRYSRLLVIRKANVTEHGQKWWCRCECGNECAVLGSNLRYGNTQSCGCLQRERVANAKTTHGHSSNPEFNRWVKMLARCLNPGSPEFPYYGGRGIAVCERWQGPDGFTNFFADMGPCPSGLTLDRIDNDGPYSPENCRWATATEQQNNKRSNRRVTFKGETHTVAEWAKKLDMKSGTLSCRLRVGWSVEEALSTPVAKKFDGSQGRCR